MIGLQGLTGTRRSSWVGPPPVGSRVFRLPPDGITRVSGLGLLSLRVSDGSDHHQLVVAGGLRGWPALVRCWSPDGPPGMTEPLPFFYPLPVSSFMFTHNCIFFNLSFNCKWLLITSEKLLDLLYLGLEIWNPVHCMVVHVVVLSGWCQLWLVCLFRAMFDDF